MQMQQTDRTELEVEPILCIDITSQGIRSDVEAQPALTTLS